MTYFDVSQLAADTYFLSRVAACYAIETLDGGHDNPYGWASQHAWDMAAQPGFGDAYAYALANDNPEPGKDTAVITEGQILSAVQSLL